MKIAVTYENGQIFQHFGHTAQFNARRVEPETPTAVIFGIFAPFFLEIRGYSFVITAQISSKIPRREVIYQF